MSLKAIMPLIIVCIILSSVSFQVEGSSPIIIKITSTTSQLYGVLIYYKTSSDAPVQEGVYISQKGNQTFTINGIVMSVEVSPYPILYTQKESKITLELIRNNKILYSVWTSKSEWLTYDYLKNSLPEESILDQIPAYPSISIIIGLSITIIYIWIKKR